MSWWMPLVVAGAGLAGIAMAMSLTAGRPRSSSASSSGGSGKSRYRQDNDLSWNLAAYSTVAGLLGGLVLLIVLVEVL